MEAPVRPLKVGRRLKATRERQFLTQDRLAKQSGISQKQISQIEHNKVEPRFSTILRLAEVLKVDPVDLIDED